MRDESSLDLILQIRLDVLEQVAAEVDEVLTAIEAHRDQLERIEEYLRAEGILRGKVTTVRNDLNNAKGRLSGSPAPPRRQVGLVNPHTEGQRPSISDKYGREAEIKRAQGAVTGAWRALSDVLNDIEKAHADFVEIRKWSIGELADEKLLKVALSHYRASLNRIRKSSQAWSEYEEQLPRKGQELFSEYLELAGGMAVRREIRDSAVISKATQLTQDLLQGEDPDASPRPSPLVMGMIGRQHRPLGYDRWSLWALPLIGRTLGEQVVRKLRTDLAEPLVVICADLYAQHVIGPSYLYASMFLDFDPHPDANGRGEPPDTLRAFLLLENLQHLIGADEVLMRGIAERLEKEWRRARSVVGGDEPTLAPEDRARIDEFMIEIRRDVITTAYDAKRELENQQFGNALADEKQQLDPLRLRQLLSAMWHGRMQNPDEAKIIHERARTVPSPQERQTAQPRKGGVSRGTFG